MDEYEGNDKKFSSYTFGDARTGIKQLVEFTCCSEDVDEVKKFLREKVRTIEVQTTHTVNVSHGGYGRYSRYQIVQHKYAGGGDGSCCGYTEVLEIKNAPKGRCPFVIHEWTLSRGECFTEWETLADALAAFEKSWSSHSRPKTFAGLHGFKRRVECGLLSAWFYAIGEEELIGDYAVPYGIEDDPVFRLGKKFVVADKDNNFGVKTCMGTRFVREVSESYYGSEQRVVTFRLVYWDDGSVWDERHETEHTPRLLDEKEMWVTEALAQFKAVLAGKKTSFAINFLNGTKFFGSVRETKPRSDHEGRYCATVHFSGGKEKKKEGWFDFKPTPEAPDVVTFLKQKLEKEGKTIQKVTIKEKETANKGKKWAGVFLSRQ